MNGSSQNRRRLSRLMDRQTARAISAATFCPAPVWQEHPAILYIDMKTLDDGRSDAARLWIKQSHNSNDAGGPYSVEQYELNCGAREIRTVSFAKYDASGNVIGSREGGKSGSIVPDTLGETLFNGMCRSN
jgi:hypothetical protein